MKDIINRHGRFHNRIRMALALLGCAALVGTATAQTQYQFGYGNELTEERAPYHPIEATLDGGTIMVGTSATTTDRNLSMIKLNATGGIQWTRLFGSAATGWQEDGYDVMEVRDLNGNTNGYVAVGSIIDPSSTNRDVYMVKVDQNGVILWEYRYGSPGLDEVGHSIVRSGNRYLVTGVVRNPSIAGSSDVLFLRTDENGASPMICSVGVANIDDGGYGITMMGSTAIIAGFTMNGNATDGLLLGVDPASGGVTGIPRRYGSISNNDTLYSVTLVGNRLLAAGTVGYSSAIKDMWGLAVEAATFNIIWNNTYNAFVSGSSYNRINLGADIQSIGDSYALVGTTAANPDNPPTTYTRYIVLTKLTTANGWPIANAAKVYGGSSSFGKAAQGYGLREAGGPGTGIYLVGGQQNFNPIPGTTGGKFDFYLIRAVASLSTSCAGNPTIAYSAYSGNAYVEMISNCWDPGKVPCTSGETLLVKARELCCIGCKPVFESESHSPEPSGDLSLDVHGDAATGEVHVEVAGVEQGTTIDIFDAGGRMVRSFEIGSSSRTGTIIWDGGDNSGNRLPNGLYFVRAQGAQSVITRPAHLVR